MTKTKYIVIIVISIMYICSLSGCSDKGPSNREKFNTYQIKDFWPDIKRVNRLNEAGQIAGLCEPDDPKKGRYNAFIQDPVTGFKDLGPCESVDLLSENGCVGGTSWDDEKRNQACIWIDGKRIDIGIPEGCDRSWIWNINNQCQAVGESTAKDDSRITFFWSEKTGRIDLGTLGGKDTRAWHINNSGQIVGKSKTGDGESHAFLWSLEIGMKDIHKPGWRSSYAHGSNDEGIILGSYYDEGSDSSIFIYKDGQIHDSGIIQKRAHIFYDPDLLIFTGQKSYENAPKLYKWDDGQVKEIAELPDNFQIREINKNYQAIGFLKKQLTLWEKDKGTIPLIELLPENCEFTTIDSFKDFNSKGQILGIGKKPKWPEAFIMNPVADWQD